MRKTALITLILLISILLGGCSPQVDEPSPTDIPATKPAPTQPPLPSDTPTPEPEPTATPMRITEWQEITGIWVNPKGRGKRLSIYGDGSVSMWVEGYGEAFPIVLWFEDGLLQAREDTQDFCTQEIGSYEASGVPGSYLDLMVKDDPCAQDRLLRGKWIDKLSQ